MKSTLTKKDKISMALAKSLGRSMSEIPTGTYCEFRQDNKHVDFSNRQQKLLFLLGAMGYEHNPDRVLSYIRELERARKTGDFDYLPNNVTILIKIKDLAKKMFGRSTPSTIAQLRLLIQDLANTKAVFFAEETGMRMEGSLIMIDYAGWDDTCQQRDFVKLAFGTVFFWNIDLNFCLMPDELFTAWGRKGNGSETDIFPKLVAKLLGAAPFKEGNKKNNKFEMNFDTIKSLVKTDYSSNWNVRNRFRSYLGKGLDLLQKVGLCSAWEFSVGSKGQDKMIVWFNTDSKQK